MAEPIIKCLCGGTAHLEPFTGLKTMVNGNPYTRWRYVCYKCKEGTFNIVGSPTKEKAYKKYIDNMRMAKELAEEFDVSVSHFLMTVNK